MRVFYVTIKFFIFFEKQFRCFFCHLYMDVIGDKKHQKTSFIFIVKNTTLNALKKAIGLDNVSTAKHRKVTPANTFYIQNQYI